MQTSDPLAAFRLEGKTALITGPTRGIGLAIARLFAGAGARLVLADIDAPACDALAATLGAISLPTDVSDAAALAHLADQAEAQTGGIDILVCNAGIAGSAAPMHAMADSDRDTLYTVNLLHPLRLTGLIAPRMAARGRGSIVHRGPARQRHARPLWHDQGCPGAVSPQSRGGMGSVRRPHQRHRARPHRNRMGGRDPVQPGPRRTPPRPHPAPPCRLAR